MDVLSVLDKVWQLARARKFRARVEGELGWDHSLIINLDGPNKKWRSLAFKVTASKTEEFVIAKGKIEARSTDRWVEFVDLASELSLPITVDANRQWEGSIGGSTLVRALKASLGAVQTYQLRVVVEDNHGSKLRTNPIDATERELLREEGY